MADFKKAYLENIKAEGGFKLHKVPGDTAGLTFAGITRKWYPDWSGWEIIDYCPNGNYPQKLFDAVEMFYKETFWDKIKGDSILSNNCAETIYDFSINAGIATSIKLTQITLGLQPDGIFGKVTLGVLNQQKEDDFIIMFSLLKIIRYVNICNNDNIQDKFLRGWLNRVINDLTEIGVK
jgi:lysozyme family protein